MDAVKQSVSLERFTVDDGSAITFTEEELNQLQEYSRRNQRLRLFLANPSDQDMPTLDLPDFFVAVRECTDHDTAVYFMVKKLAPTVPFPGDVGRPS